MLDPAGPVLSGRGWGCGGCRAGVNYGCLRRTGTAARQSVRRSVRQGVPPVQAGLAQEGWGGTVELSPGTAARPLG